MVQTQLAEVAPRYVTCARARTTRGSALRSRSPITGQGGYKRLSAHSGRPSEATPLKEFTNPRWERLGSAPGQFLLQVPLSYPPWPDLTLNSATYPCCTARIMPLAFLVRLESLLCLVRFL